MGPRLCRPNDRRLRLTEPTSALVASLRAPASLIPREPTNWTRNHGQSAGHMLLCRSVGALMTARLHSCPSRSLAFIDITPGGPAHGVRRLQLQCAECEPRPWHRLVALCSSHWGSDSACRQQTGRPSASGGQQQRRRLAAAAVAQQPAAPAVPTVVTCLCRRPGCTSMP
jgi:hypothetical protein